MKGLLNQLDLKNLKILPFTSHFHKHFNKEFILLNENVIK